MTRYACPCCGYYTLDEEPPGTYLICPVCFWEDDPVQFRRPTRAGGANRPSLVEARANFRELGANDPRERDLVRPPRDDELPPDDIIFVPDIHVYGADAERQGAFVVWIPPGISTHNQLIAVLSPVLAAQPHPGEGWDAFLDYLYALSHLPNRRIVLVHHDVPFRRRPRDAASYIETLMDLAGHERGPDAPTLQAAFPISAQRDVLPLLP